MPSKINFVAGKLVMKYIPSTSLLAKFILEFIKLFTFKSIPFVGWCSLSGAAIVAKHATGVLSSRSGAREATRE